MSDSLQNILREAADRLIQTAEHLGRVASMSLTNSAAEMTPPLPATSSVVTAGGNNEPFLRVLRNTGTRAFIFREQGILSNYFQGTRKLLIRLLGSREH